MRQCRSLLVPRSPADELACGHMCKLLQLEWSEILHLHADAGIHSVKLISTLDCSLDKVLSLAAEYDLISTWCAIFGSISCLAQ